MTDLPFGEPLTGPNAGAAPPRRCTHPRQFRDNHDVIAGNITLRYQTCGRCGKTLDPAAQRAGRRNRKRGNRAELPVARSVGGEKMGERGLPWDVVIAGYARIQVRKYAEPQSVRKIMAALSAIEAAPGPEAAVYIWLEAGSTREGLVIQRYRDWVAERGITVDDA